MLIRKTDREFIPMKKAGEYACLKKSQTYELRQLQRFPAVMDELWGRSILMVPTLDLMEYIKIRIQRKKNQRENLKKEIGKLEYNLQALRNFYNGH